MDSERKPLYILLALAVVWVGLPVFLGLVVLVAAGLMVFVSSPDFGEDQEVARLSLSATDQGATTVDLDAGQVDLWTDLDLEWSGSLELRHQVELWQAGKLVAATTCDPLDLHHRRLSVITNHGDAHSRRYQGDLLCLLWLDRAGPTEIRARRELSHSGDSLHLTQLDLVVYD